MLYPIFHCWCRKCHPRWIRRRQRSSWSQYHGKESEAEVHWLQGNWMCGPGETLPTDWVEEVQGCDMWPEWLILEKKKQGRQQMDHAQRQRLMEFPKGSCADEAGCFGLPLRAVLRDLPFLHHPGWSLLGATPGQWERVESCYWMSSYNARKLATHFTDANSVEPPKISMG